jgi:hypothetical protein
MGMRKSYKDPNLVPANIKAGVTVLGTVGSMPIGKQYASGTVTPSSSTKTYVNWGGSNVSWFEVAVSGLSFTPSTIILFNSSAYLGVTTYNATMDISSNTAKICLTSGSSVADYLKLTGNATVTSTGFTLPYANNGTNAGSVKWVAIE